MQYDGYNIVRVFIDVGNWDRANYMTTQGIAGSYNAGPTGGYYFDASYVNNFVDFVQRANNHGIYVIPIIEGIPYNAYYQSQVIPSDCGSIIQWPNGETMCPGLVAAEKQFVMDFVSDVKSKLTADQFSAIMAYELANEIQFSASVAPFNQTAGNVTTADGNTYDMSVSSQRQQAADANMVSWASTLTNSIKGVAPNAMTAVGFFTFLAIGQPGGPAGLPLPSAGGSPDGRYPGRPVIATLYSNVDFVDLHVYPGDYVGPYSFSSDVASSEWSLIYGPLLMGEYGAFTSYYPSITSAANGMRDLQVQSCSYNFTGWLFWTYDTSEQAGLYYLSQNGGAIDGVLAPAVRPNPCTP